MGADGLLGGIGARIPLGHGEVGVTEEHLHVDFARTGLDRPGGEGVTETVGVDTVDTGALPETLEDDAEGVPGRHGHMVRSEEEGAGSGTTEAFDILSETQRCFSPQPHGSHLVN